MSFGGLLEILQGVWRAWKVSVDPEEFPGGVGKCSGRMPSSVASQPSALTPSKRAFSSTRDGEVNSEMSQDTIPVKSYSKDELALHNTPDDCWIVVKDKVYNVTAFGRQHPGGPVLFTQAGRDATDTFSLFHSPTAWNVLQEFYIGKFDNDDVVPDIIRDYRELRMSLLRARLFKSSKLYYTGKALTNLAILAGSILIIWNYQSLFAVLSSAFALAVFWQQCGWLSHDFLHHQVLEKRSINTILGGYLFGNVLQGFSCDWWKSKHNVHHAATNECNNKYQPIDPDIDTVPLIAWSKDIAATVDSETFRSIIRHQHLLFFPLLVVARFSWLLSSWNHTNAPYISDGKKMLEKSSIIMYYVWNFAVAFSFLHPGKAIIWLLFSQFFAGFLLSFVFVLSHNGMDVYNDSRDFVTAQLSSTRDVQTSAFNDWFTGGLNRQIEHHLFPTLPRHNLGKVAPYVKALCKKHGLVYEDVSMRTGAYKVLLRLAEVAAAA